MLSEREVSTSIGSTAYGVNGDKLGTVEHFFVDDRTGAPTWVAVATGLFGTRHSIVPAADATFDEAAGLRLPVTSEAVKSAPQVTGDHLTPDDEAELRRHYGVGQQPAVPAAEVPPADETSADVPVATERPAAGRPAADEPTGAPPVDTDGGMVRTEERLVVGTERVARTRARLIKYVVTEEVQITVPIRREEFRIEEVPLDAPDVPAESLTEDADTPGAAGRTTGDGGLPSEIILHTERPVVTVEVVPVERVRLRTEVVQGQETVTERVQREQIAVDQHAVPQRTVADPADPADSGRNGPRHAAPGDTEA
jgi:stress response protein YsnF